MLYNTGHSAHKTSVSGLKYLFQLIFLFVKYFVYYIEIS